MRVTATHRRSSFAIHVCEANVNSVKSKSIYAARARNITAHSVGQRSQLKEDASTSEKMMNAIQNLAMHAPFALNAPPAMRSSAKIVPLFVMSAQGHTAMHAMVMSSNIIHVVVATSAIAPTVWIPLMFPCVMSVGNCIALIADFCIFEIQGAMDVQR